jgi:glycosyltransferase involved in cell wall biosynthesis
MHVGVVSHSDPDYAFDLANALDRAQVAVSLYLSRRHVVATVNSADWPTERVFEHGLLDATVKLRLYQLPRIRDPRSFAGVRKLSRSMREDGIDVAHILVGGGEIWLAVLAHILRKSHDIPVASTIIVPRPNPGEYPPPFVQSAVNRLLTHCSDAIIANGKNEVNLVQELYGVPERRLCCVQLGPRTTSARWATKTLPEEPGTILFFGRITFYKGLDYLVQAQPIITDQVPHARIIVAGRGEEELDRCRSMIQDDTRFEIHDGFVPNDMMAELFQRASVVVLPYRSASTSGVLMMAYVFGKPVVATRVGSLPEYVDDGVTGLLVPPGNTAQLAEAVVRLLSDDALRHRMGANAKRRVAEEQRKAAMQSLTAYQRTISIHQGN